MADISKTTFNKLAITRTLTTVAEVHADTLAKELAAVWFPDGVPEPLTLRDVVLAPTRLLERIYQQVEQDDQRVAKERGEDAAVRDARDARMGPLHVFLSELRDGMKIQYGSKVVAAYGLGTPPPSSGDALLAYTRNVVKTLAAGPPKAAPISRLVRVDFAQASTTITSALAALDADLRDLDREKRETQAAIAERDAADGDWRYRYAPVAQYLEALLTMAGKDALAERVRPTARRRAGEPEATDQLPPEGSTGPAAGSAGTGPIVSPAPEATGPEAGGTSTAGS